MHTFGIYSPDQQAGIQAGLGNLCRLFWGPDEALCRKLLEGTFMEPFRELAAALPADAAEALARMETGMAAMADPAELHRILAAAYVRLFINAGQGLAVPLYQSCYAYDGAPLMGPSALRMRQRLQAVGLTLNTGANEPPDHLAVELEYLFFLIEKGWTDQDASRLAEAAAFADVEVGSWIDVFVDRLARAPEPLLFAPAAILARSLIHLIAQSS